MASSRSAALAPIEQIGRSILLLRGQRVILDRDLAATYGITTMRLNEQIKRNADRFPEDFVFQLTLEEAELSRSQIATLKAGRGQNIKYRPYVFTEHGAIQAANVLNSPRAIAMGVYDELLGLHRGGSGRRGPTPLLQKQIERLKRLPKAQQKVVMQMLDGILSQSGR